MEEISLSDLIKALGTDSSTVYVAPLINHQHPDSDYLYNLYKPIITSNSQIEVKSVSVFTHFKPFFTTLFSRNVVFHYHWLEFQDIKSLMGMPWKLIWILLYKLVGGKLIWTIHNEEPHDQKFLSMHLFLHKTMARLANAIHVHCATAGKTMSAKLGVSLTKFHVIPHPSFPAKSIPRKESIETLNTSFGLDLEPSKPLALIFGQISHYKQIEEILVDFRDDDSIQFLIVGTVKKGNEELGESLRRLASEYSHIHLIDTFIKDSHLPFIFNASDVCLFNYKRLLTSGGVHMALSYNIDIIAPKLGCIAELESNPSVFLFETNTERTAMIRNITKHG
tara:strand:- start:7624 stop:8631 length:1008 start_codon:yes stop_codon:yes gene_type:complete